MEKNNNDHSSHSSGLENVGTLDAFAHDTENNVLILAMFEVRPWDLGELQLFQLQEKLNAYLSFILDGEMLESFPDFKDTPVRIELRTVYEPNQQALDFLGRVKEQISHQNIDLEVVLVEENLGGCCGGSQSSCCSDSGDECCNNEDSCCSDDECCNNEDSCCSNENEQDCSKESELESSPHKNRGGCGCS